MWTRFERRWWSSCSSQRQADRRAWAAAVVVWCAVGCLVTIAAAVLASLE